MLSVPKKFINAPKDVVTQTIEGMAEVYNHLAYLDGFPEVKVLLRADVPRNTYNKVALISGGGSGHEPAHGGYVGEGMLTAAVCGDVFASPTSSAVLAAIRAVTGPPGCLLIVKNYTGDRLSFGLAAEMAKAEGFKVEVVIVGDDCALEPGTGTAGRRGLAGTLFVHKVAGGAAAAGLSLEQVTAEARKVAASVGTVGVGLTSCNLPGNTMMNDRIAPEKMEFGLGIHGEPGISVINMVPADKIVQLLLERLLKDSSRLGINKGDAVALMVNGLGSTSMMELMIATGEATGHLPLKQGLSVDRVYVGSFMTSLDMAGMSLSVLRVDEQVLERLDAPTMAPAWPVACTGHRPTTTLPLPLPPAPDDSAQPSARPTVLTPLGKMVEATVASAGKAVLSLEASLNEWDRLVGDGDTGTTMAKGASAILEDLATRYPVNDPVATLAEISKSVARSMGGTSGVLYSIFFRAAYASIKGTPATAADWALAFEAANAAVSTYGGASVGWRTMLDALVPAAEALRKGLENRKGPSAAEALLEAALAAAGGAQATLGMDALAGRSSYIPKELLRTVPDPGAKAAAAWLQAVANTIASFPTNVCQT